MLQVPGDGPRYRAAFPGAGAEPKITRQWKKLKREGRRVTSEDVATDPRIARIHRTQSRRDATAAQIKDFRKKFS